MTLLRSNENEHKLVEQALEVLERAVENHTKWLQNVHESVICGIAVDEATLANNAHRCCKLGLWYYREASDVFQQYSEFVELEESHRLMHDAARDLLLNKAEVLLELEAYQNFIQKQQEVIQLLLKLKDKLVGTFHSYDSLTGAVNRSAFNLFAQKEQARIDRENSYCSVALIDIDHFKAINDNLGHVAGDHALRAFAQEIKQSIRKSDILCRFGGEEFVLLLSGTRLDEATKLVDKIRASVAKKEFEISENLSVNIHFSAGVSECQPGGEIEGCLEDADKKLYEAKHAGRNLVVS